MNSSRRQSVKERPLPQTPHEWLDEIKLAITDASGESYGRGVQSPDAFTNLFHLAPVVCLKFRGRKLRGPEADRVTKVALANYVVNSNPEGIDHGLENRHLMAFALCYVTAHLALELVDEEEAEAILDFSEEHLEQA